MKIDIYSDVVCPWCWIGKARLAQALAALGEEAESIEIHWQPFLLDPEADATPVPLREAYARKFGGAERTEQLLQQTESTARSEGLPMDFSQAQVRVTTRLAHRLLWLAGEQGRQDAVAEALFRAHFQYGRNLADPAVLLQAGTDGGLTAAAVQGLLDSDQGTAEVEAGLRRAAALGIRSVPTFVIDDRWAIQGAQPAAEIVTALRGMRREQAAPTTPGEAGEGAGGGDAGERGV